MERGGGIGADQPVEGDVAAGLVFPVARRARQLGDELLQLLAGDVRKNVVEVAAVSTEHGRDAGWLVRVGPAREPGNGLKQAQSCLALLAGARRDVDGFPVVAL